MAFVLPRVRARTNIWLGEASRSGIARRERVLRLVRVWGVITIAFSLSSVAVAQQGRVTARELVEEIKKQVCVERKNATVPTCKAGNPDTAVTGVAVTMM